MAFRTNKMPVLQEKSASGAVATFNTALAMPLPSCNIAVNAWQEGSGDPSPSNVRPIHGFSEVNVTANNVVKTIQLGQEVYGAEVDAVNGVAHVTHSIVDMGDLNWNYRDDNLCFYVSVDGMKDYVNTTNYADTMNEMFKFGGLKGLSSALANLYYYVRSSPSSHMILVRYDDYTTASDFTSAVTGKKLVFELAEPFDIQLTPTQIQTLIGNNTIFADTGDVDLTFKDLDIAKRGNFREVFRLPS